MHICKMARGSAKWRGLSPWKTPFEVAFIGDGHVWPMIVPLEAIAPRKSKTETAISPAKKDT